MKKKIFSKGLYGEALLRLKIFTIILTVVGVITSIAPFIEYGYLYIVSKIEKTSTSFEIVDSFHLCDTALIVVTICAFIMPLLVFCQFNSRKFCDFYLSLPYTKTCLFVSFIAAVFTMLLGMFATFVGLKVLLYCLFRNLFIINFNGFGIRLITELSAMLFVSAVATLACSITNKTFASIITGLVIGIAPRLLIAAIQITTCLTTPILTMIPLSSVFSSSLNSLVYIFSSLIYDENLSAIPAIYTTAISVLYFFIALCFFKIKKSENIGQPSHNKLLQAVTRILLGLALTIIPTMILTGIIMANDSGWEEMGLAIALLIPVYLFAAVAYFAYELITTKKWKRVLMAMPGFAIVLGIDIICALCVFGCSSAALSYVPSAESIDSVKIINDAEEGLLERFIGTDSYYMYGDYNSFEKTANSVEFKSEDVNKVISEVIKDEVNNAKGIEDVGTNFSSSYAKTMIFKIKDHGITRYRSLSLTQVQYNDLMESVSQNDEYRKVYTTVPAAVNGTMMNSNYNDWKPDKAKEDEILKTLQEEITEAGYDKWNKALNRDWDYNINSSGYVINMNYPNELSFMYISKNSCNPVNVKVYYDVTPKTYDLISEEIYESSKKDFITIADAIINMAPAKDDDYKHCNLEVSLFDSESKTNVSTAIYYDGYNYGKYVGNSNLDLCKGMATEIKRIYEMAGDEKPTGQKYIDVSIEVSDSDFTTVLSSGYNWKNIRLPIPEDYDINVLVEMIDENNSYEYDNVVYDEPAAVNY